GTAAPAHRCPTSPRSPAMAEVPEDWEDLADGTVRALPFTDQSGRSAHRARFGFICPGCGEEFACNVVIPDLPAEEESDG
ncbi:MAG: hypothetical protein ACRDQH_01390, partial [Pseudonocardiaceae bacterium]